ncbi:MAG: SDR family oxidoreductase [Candidatus Sericytochromatia bacterium]
MNKYLIITGGSKGIGFATIKKFLENNWKVINISRTKCNLESVFNIELDLLQPNWEEILSQIIKEQITEKAIISLVHNSAMLEKDNVLNVDSESFRKVLELNVIVPTRLNKVFFEYFKENSSIIYIGSTLSEKAVQNTLSYVTSKHALIGLMRATCQDLVGKDIHTACVCPGFTDTEMLREHIGNNPEIIKSIESIICAGRLLKPSEIADVIYFCANNPSLNGSVLHANLGNIER